MSCLCRVSSDTHYSTPILTKPCMFNVNVHDASAYIYRLHLHDNRHNHDVMISVSACQDLQYDWFMEMFKKHIMAYTICSISNVVFASYVAIHSISLHFTYESDCGSKCKYTPQRHILISLVAHQTPTFQHPIRNFVLVTPVINHQNTYPGHTHPDITSK